VRSYFCYGRHLRPEPLHRIVPQTPPLAANGVTS